MTSGKDLLRVIYGFILRKSTLTHWQKMTAWDRDMKLERMDDLKNVESAASVSSGGSNVSSAGRGAANTTSNDLNYSIPGILHFLQHEWSRFEMERGQWEVERAELQVRYSFTLCYSRLFPPIFTLKHLNLEYWLTNYISWQSNCQIVPNMCDIFKIFLFTTICSRSDIENCIFFY